MSDINRRQFVKLGLAGAAAVSLAGAGTVRAADAVALPPLPWAENALEPYISARTISFHYGKHHAGYVKKVNKAVAGTQLAGKSVEDILLTLTGKQPIQIKGRQSLFQNAAQVYNHTFYWNSLKPGGGGAPKGELAKAIEKSFGSLDKCKAWLAQAAGAQFGSGWAWLYVDKTGRIVAGRTPNAATPFTRRVKPLLTIDVWEHAYYLDYQNRRGDYVKAVIDNLLNWDMAAERFAAKGRG